MRARRDRTRRHTRTEREVGVPLRVRRREERLVAESRRHGRAEGVEREPVAFEEREMPAAVYFWCVRHAGTFVIANGQVVRARRPGEPAGPRP